MEPLFFKAENRRFPVSFWTYPQRFNGAAFFQSGKCSLLRITVIGISSLQWSRFFSKRKIRSFVPVFGLWESFNGAAFFQSGKWLRWFGSRCRLAWLQWSRFFSKRKISTLLTTWTAPDSSFNGAAFFQSGKSEQVRELFWRGLASMEPLFFKAENGNRHRTELRNIRLQWSRFFSKRKIPFSRYLVGSRLECFNGAAFFQSGKLQVLTRENMELRQLQWSRFFSKRKMRNSGVNARDLTTLQWSRFFSKRKIPVRTRRTRAGRFCFNGAAFFQSGKSKLRFSTFKRHS